MRFALHYALRLCFRFAHLPKTAGVTVTVNGKALTTDVAPQIINGITMLPMRAVFETLGANVTWAAEDKMIFATKGGTLITLKIGAAQMNVQTISAEGSRIIPLDAAPFIYENRTMIPVRAAAEALNASVSWNGETRTAAITTGKTQRNGGAL